MASIVFTLVDSKNGINTVAYDIEDADMERIYKSYRYLFAPIPDPEYPSEIKPLPSKEVVYKVSEGIVRRLLADVRDLEAQMILDKSNLKEIAVREVK